MSNNGNHLALENLGKEDGQVTTEQENYEREDFKFTTSNKQFNFLQHIMTALKVGGRAGEGIRTCSGSKTTPSKTSTAYRTQTCWLRKSPKIWRRRWKVLRRLRGS